MIAPTPEEQRAEDYRRAQEKRRRFQAQLKRRLRGNTAAAHDLRRKTRAALASSCGDTSRPENRK